MANSLLIKKPWVTEKATDISAMGKYVFLVDRSATKPEIRKAISAIYKVDVVDVQVINCPPKHKRFGRGLKGSREGYRKAVVTLKSGQKIDIQ